MIKINELYSYYSWEEITSEFDPEENNELEFMANEQQKVDAVLVDACEFEDKCYILVEINEDENIIEYFIEITDDEVEIQGDRLFRCIFYHSGSEMFNNLVEALNA